MDNITFLGESYGFWVQTGAVILSILVTGYYARKAILSNGHSAKNTLEHNHAMQKKRATIDLILQENQDNELNKAKGIISDLPEKASFIEYLNVNKDDDISKREIKEAIRILLNRYEFIALGIKHDAFEEQIYKELQFSDLTNVWKKAKSMIIELRHQREKDTYYQEFEWLAERWLKAPLEPHKKQ